MRRPAALASALGGSLLWASLGCSPGLAEGEIGEVRVMGTVQGDPPRLIPPVLDRDGNYYVLEGALDFAIETRVTVGAVGGGWRSSCRLGSGDRYGVHGWLGGTQRARWYWSGFSLVGVEGHTASCHPVLEVDPSTGAALRFVGVVPDVRDAPSTTSVVAMIQSPSDPLPFVSVIDLINDRYDRLRTFEPDEARNVFVLGTGADKKNGTGVFVVGFQLASTLRVEALFYDDRARLQERFAVDVPETLGEYSIRGFVEFSDAGLGAAVIGDGFVLALAGGKSKLLDPLESHDMEAIGVHRFGGELYVVGTRKGGPVVAPLDSGARLGEPQKWNSSLGVQSRLDSLGVVDDRSLPFAEQAWTDVRSAVGEFPFLSPYTPDIVARGTVAWAFAGPDFLAGGNTITQIGVGAAGISYP